MKAWIVIRWTSIALLIDMLVPLALGEEPFRGYMFVVGALVAFLAISSATIELRRRKP